MENISLSIINLRTNKEVAHATNQVYINKNPYFQRAYEAWDDKLRTRFIESMLLGRATNPIWTILNDDEEEEEVLDGMHRITTALEFFNNKFHLNKNYFMNLDGNVYDKKKFDDLSPDDKAKIRNYSFIFNKLDSSYHKDKNKLRDMYEILNRSSKSLTDYEFNKVIYSPFYAVINKFKDQFSELNFFSKKDKRGDLDLEIIEMVVLFFPLEKTWTSLTNLVEDFLKHKVGDTSEKVNEYVSKNEEDISSKLTLTFKVIKEFSDRLFSTEKKVFKHHYLSYKFIVSRCIFHIKNFALFQRLCDRLIERFSSQILIDTIEQELSCKNRNAVFQRKLIEKIDQVIDTEIKNDDNSVRLFPKKMIQEKLKIQNKVCPECTKTIKDKDEYEGDHIVPWTLGGKTVIENLQVLHKRCHQIK
jgi:Mn-dependent DtxR family transcriptional regulator